MRLLFLCNKLPYPPKEGGSMAMNMIIEGAIEAGHKVKVLAVSSYKNPYIPSKIPDSYKAKTRLEAVEVDLKPKVFPALYCFFLRKSYHVHRFISEEFDQKLIEILKAEEFDIVQIETVYLTPYLKTVQKHSGAKVFLRAHNIEHLIWQRLAENTKNPFKKLYLDHLSIQLKNYEIDHLEKYDGIVCISKVDEKYYSNFTNKQFITASFGVNPQAYQPTGIAKVETSIFFIGALNWMPNAEGLQWFLKNSWPDIKELFPKLNFYIASKDIPKWVKDFRSKQIHWVGEVDDAKAFISSGSVMVVPLLSGSGIRIKIIEGMALGKAVLTTSIGAEGIEFEDGKNILIANTKEEFVNQIKTCLNQPNLVKEIGVNARKTIAANHDCEKIMEELLSFYHKTIQ